MLLLVRAHSLRVQNILLSSTLFPEKHIQLQNHCLDTPKEPQTQYTYNRNLHFPYEPLFSRALLWALLSTIFQACNLENTLEIPSRARHPTFLIDFNSVDIFFQPLWHYLSLGTHLSHLWDWKTVEVAVVDDIPIPETLDCHFPDEVPQWSHAGYQMQIPNHAFCPFGIGPVIFYFLPLLTSYPLLYGTNYVIGVRSVIQNWSKMWLPSGGFFGYIPPQVWISQTSVVCADPSNATCHTASHSHCVTVWEATGGLIVVAFVSPF